MTKEEAREWLLGCIYHDGFVETKRFDVPTQVIREALEKQSEIVHCKECKYWVRATLEGFYRTSQVPACELAGWLCGEGGFCLYGVRKVEHEID